VVVPALLYVLIKHRSRRAPRLGDTHGDRYRLCGRRPVLIGKEVPPALRMLLLTLAIIDDIAAILVIAFFYSSGIAVGGC